MQFAALKCMQLVKVLQCSLSDSMSAAYSEYMHFRAGTPNCLHHTMITYGDCHSKGKKEHNHWCICCQAVATRKVDE